MVRRGLAVVVLVLISGGCAERDTEMEQTGTPSSTSSPTRRALWAQPAIDFFDGWAQHHPKHADRFYAPDVESTTAAGANEPSGPPNEWWIHQDQLQERLVFLSQRRVALLQVPLLPTGFPTRLHVLGMAAQRIASEARDIAPVRTLSGHAIPRGSADRLALLYNNYLEAWESGALSSIRALYQPGATRRDELLSMATIKPGRIEGPTDFGPLVGSAARYTPVDHPSWRGNAQCRPCTPRGPR